MRFVQTCKEFIKRWALPPGIQKLLASILYRKNTSRISQRSKEENRLLQDSQKIKGIHQGKRCFLLGAGSSISKQDLKKLQGEFVISVSNTFVHPDYSLIKPQYHVLPHILEGHGRLYTEDHFVGWLKEMEEKTLDAEMFFHIGDRNLICNNNLFKNRKIHWVDFVEKTRINVSPVDLSRVPSIWSVSELAITVAIYLGFDEIYLLGFDHDWFNGPLVYFYDHSKDHALKPNAKSLDFADAEFQMRRHADIFKKYKELYQIKNNIYNANADPCHYMDVFPRIDYDSLFNRD